MSSKGLVIPGPFFILTVTTREDNRMRENGKKGPHTSLNKAKVTEAINMMLDCLLRHCGANCKKCKRCPDVHACCFLMDALFVIHYRNKAM